MAETANRLIRGSLLTTSSLVVSVVISFFLMPFMVESLGDRLYGVWTLVAEFLWYYGLLDFGFSSAIGRYLARAVGARDKEDYQKTVATGFYLTLGLGLLALLATSGLILLATWVIADPVDRKLFQILSLVLGINFAFEFPVRVFNSVLGSHLRRDITMGVAIGKNILIALLVVTVLKMGYSLIAVAVVSALGSMTESLIRIYFAYRIEPNLSLAWVSFSRARFKQLMGYSAFSFIAKVADILRFKIDVFVITAFVGLKDVTHYYIGARLLEYFMQFIRSGLDVIAPVFSQEEGKNDYNSIREKFLFVTKISVYLAVFFGGLGLLYGKPFILRWMGARFEDSYGVFVILVIPAIVALLQNPSDHLLYGIAKHKFLAYASFVEGCANAVISLSLVRSLGIYGVALGTAIPMLIRYLVTPFFVCRLIELNLFRYFRVLILHAGVATLVLLAAWSLTTGFIRVDYVYLSSIFVFVNVVFWPTVFFAGFKSNERAYILRFVGWQNAS